jgi:hypothetical protein
MKTGPEWKDNPGTGVCPVPPEHLVEVRFRKKSNLTLMAGRFWWYIKQFDEDILEFRDWTAWKEQQPQADIYFTVKMISILKSRLPINSEVYLTSDGIDLIVNVQIPKRIAKSGQYTTYSAIRKFSIKRTDVNWVHVASEIMERYNNDEG